MALLVTVAFGVARLGALLVAVACGVARLGAILVVPVFNFLVVFMMMPFRLGPAVVTASHWAWASVGIARGRGGAEWGFSGRDRAVSHLGRRHWGAHGGVGHH